MGNINRIESAYEFYRNHIFEESLFQILDAHGLKVAGSVHPVKWELFGSFLTGAAGTGNTGADLDGWEVKSAGSGNSYEYQYHLNTGLEKLREDAVVNHVFCSYSPKYDEVEVWVAQGKYLTEKYFSKWIPLYQLNYDQSVDPKQRRQRFRKSISHSYVKKVGGMVLRIAKGELVYTHNEVLIKYSNNIPDEFR